MATASLMNVAQDELLNEKREGHWLPALRPDAEEQTTELIPQKLEDSTLHPESLADEEIGEIEAAQDPSDQHTFDRATAVPEFDENDGRLDPAWGIKRMDSAHILDGVQRTSSFPNFQADSATVSDPVSLDENHAPHDEEKLESWTNGEEDDELLEDDGEFDAAEAPMSTEYVSESATGPAAAIATVAPELAEASMERYSEGVPLLGQPQEAKTAESNVIASENAYSTFEADAPAEESSFFSDLNAQAANPAEPAPIDRKSTSDVLGTLSFPKDDDEAPTGFFEQLGQEKMEDLSAADPQTTSQPEAEDKWAALMEDDEFLVEDADDLLPDSEPGSPSSFIASLQNDNINIPETNLTHASSAQSQQAAISATTASNLQTQSKSYGGVGMGRPGLAPMTSFQSQLQQAPIVTRAASFVDQAKGGYKSPYDLPLDMSKPKRKPQVSRMTSQPQTSMPPPPPRSSSISSDQQMQTAFAPNQSRALVQEQTSRPGSQGDGLGVPRAVPAQKAGTPSFFEELPVTSRARPPSNGRYTPMQNANSSVQRAPMSPPRQAPPTGQAEIPPQTTDPYAQYQLRPPERLDPYANIGQQAPSGAAAAMSTRYSPAPTSAQGPPKPVPSPRYSPAPPAPSSASQARYASQPAASQAPPATTASANRYATQPTPNPASFSNPSLPFQPRTSSPLASQHRPLQNQAGMMPPPALSRSTTSPSGLTPSSPPTQGVLTQSEALSNQPVFSPPRNLDRNSPPIFAPPQRSQTQSPSRQVALKSLPAMHSESIIERPASASGHLSPPASSAQLVSVPSARPLIRSRAEVMDFVRPTDETNDDPLERWKGAPIFNFGFGGNVVTSFPTRTPRFASGLARPQMKAGVGEIKVRKADSVWTIPERTRLFPGPLRGKSKKKDVVSWLTSSISQLEADSPTFLGVSQTLPDPRKRHEEKLLLWRIVKVLVEHDGHLETMEALKAVNGILAPEVHAIDEATASQYKSELDRGGIYAPGGAGARTDTVDALAVETLRKHLLKGSLKDAVWHAVDNRLWSHALLLASTLRSDPGVWKQVVHEFVRQEVKPIGNNAESLSALYEIFGGNLEESIDQLVPPSARAGLQMVSTVDSSGPIKNALDGLDKWKETLTMVLNNRSERDYRALLTLAKLLNDYGRVEASHICLLFARNPEYPNILGGVDDAQASVTLLGVDRQPQSGGVHLDDDALLLTEVYEFATCTLSGSSATIPLPYLAPYKLQRAKDLADHGLKTEAQAYCDAVAAGLKSGSKISPYYHPLLLGELDELSNRIKQIPVQGSSWMSKPSIEKVSGSIFTRFTSFVAGDDSDAASQGSGKDAGAEIGPFANVTGSPTLSRSGSQSDIYASYPGMAPSMPQPATNSRYAPNGIMSARSSSDLARGRPSLDSQRSPPSTSYGHESKQSLYSPLVPSNQSPVQNMRAYQPLGTSPGQNFGTSPSFSNYQSTPPQSAYMPNVAEQQSLHGGHSESYTPTTFTQEQSAYAPSAPSAPQPSGVQTQESSYSAYMPSQPNETEQYGAPGSDVQQSYGYEPPTDTGYVPYQPEADPEEDESKAKPKKKSFMDDDGDDYARPSHASASSSRVASSSADTDAAARRKANDEAADAAFRAAAEADNQRAKEATAAKRSSGWFGGWLGGAKKNTDSLDTSARPSSSGDQKVYKAKLGENKMKLYYNKDLKKWINPDNPDAAKGTGATPPPPRIGGGTPAPPMGGPPRSASGGTPVLPPSIGLSRSSTPASMSGAPPGTSDSGNGVSASLPPNVTASLGIPPSGSPSLSPSPAGVPLPPSGGSTPAPPAARSAIAAASSIDDLLGPPTGGARKGARGAKKGKGGRYVDVMAQ